MSCDARQYGDEMKCGRCGLSWDANDPDPPACAKKIDRRAIPDRRITNEVRRVEVSATVAEPRRYRSRSWLAPKPAAEFRRLVEAMPAELPDALAVRMGEAYEGAMLTGGGYTEAMRAAYRILLRELGRS